MSMSVGRGLLLDAAKTFLQEWSRVRESWRDRNAEAFAERYIAPLDGQVRRATEAMDRLSEASTAARRDCE